MTPKKVRTPKKKRAPKRQEYTVQPVTLPEGTCGLSEDARHIMSLVAERGSLVIAQLVKSAKLNPEVVMRLTMAVLGLPEEEILPAITVALREMQEADGSEDPPSFSQYISAFLLEGSLQVWNDKKNRERFYAMVEKDLCKKDVH